MKRKNWMQILSAVLFITFSVYSVVTAGDKTVKFNTLPKIAQDFYTLNFGQTKIKKVEHDRLEKKYEIELWNDVSISFNEKGEWIDVDCNESSTVPQTVIDGLPTEIKDQITKSYKGNLILEIKRNLRDSKNIKYEIEIVDDKGVKREIKLN